MPLLHDTSFNCLPELNFYFVLLFISWSSTREAPSDDRSTALECAPLSSSLLNDWLGIKNLDTEAMEELRKELETNTSLLLFDT